MTTNKAVSLLWAISQVVEISDWEREDIANVLGITIREVEDLLEEAEEDFNSIGDLEDTFETYEYEDL